MSKFVLPLIVILCGTVFGDDSEFFKRKISEAEKGDPTAQFSVGASYAMGVGVKRDSAKALQWLERSANQGYDEAQIFLGRMYFVGQGVKKNQIKGFAFLHLAEKNGSSKAKRLKPQVAQQLSDTQIAEAEALAQEMVKKLPKMANGMKGHYRKLFEETLQKAQKGDSDAMAKLATLYALGNGVDKNLEEAFKWKLKAATDGISGAQFDLGWSYYRGEGVKKDVVNAYVWISLGLTNMPDNSFFKSQKGRIASQLRPNQITKAQELIKEMIKKNPKLLNK